MTAPNSAPGLGEADSYRAIALDLNRQIEVMICGMPELLEENALTDEEGLIEEAARLMDTTAFRLAQLDLEAEQAALSRPQPVIGDREVVARLDSIRSMLERVSGPTASVRIYEHEAKAILASLASRPEGGWRPIETHDGSRGSVLLWCAKRMNTYTAIWRDEEHYGEPGWFHFAGLAERVREVPTHWQPLPPPPSGEGGW